MLIFGGVCCFVAQRIPKILGKHPLYRDMAPWKFGRRLTGASFRGFGSKGSTFNSPTIALYMRNHKYGYYAIIAQNIHIAGKQRSIQVTTYLHTYDINAHFHLHFSQTFSILLTWSAVSHQREMSEVVFFEDEVGGCL